MKQPAAARTFSEFHKAFTATASAVHVPSADSKSKKKAKTFGAFIGDPAAAPPYMEKRDLKPHDETTAKTPFKYDVNALGSLRPDQVPRFFGALTDSQSLPTQNVELKNLVAMQDRVDPAQVEFFRANPDVTDKLPLIVLHDGTHLIADGHHRLAGQWLAGADTATVRVKDLEAVSNALKRMRDPNKIAKIDAGLGLVFGWAIICKVDGEDYFDRNFDFAGPHKGKWVPEHVTEDAMTKAAVEFMGTERPGNELHEGPDSGHYLFVFPMTSDIAKAMKIDTKNTGLMVAYKPTPAVLKKFIDGDYTGFSIEGRRIKIEERVQ